MKIKTNRDETLRYLGYRGGQIHDDVYCALSDCMREIEDKTEARYVYRVFGTDELDLGGQDIKRHLEGCKKCIIMAATLGIEADELIKKMQMLDMAKAVILDACGSSGIENACDRVEEMLRGEWKSKGMFVTGRFSPGYGDMPITKQKELCNLLDAQRKIGLYVTDSNALIPFKSVTAVLGISEREVYAMGQQRSCETCGLAETCNFRKDGRHCGK